jgi:hypothetical protein
MRPANGSIAVIMLVGVCVVSGVSVFAQSNTGRNRTGEAGDQRIADDHSSDAAVRIYAAAREWDADVASAANVSIPSAYQPIVATMLTRSPTFRRQYARLARALHLSVIVRSDMPAGWRMPALTHITPRHGGVEAFVYVAPSARAIELIAHEFEHIIERLDGVDLRAKARLRASGVRRTADANTFETTRAIVTGQCVAREVLGDAH